MNAVITRMAVFFGLAYAFTWFGWLGNAIWPSESWPLPMNTLGPLMAAPIAILLTDGLAGLGAWGKRLITFRAPIWVYATAFLGTLAAVLASVSLTSLAGMPMQGLPELALADFAMFIPITLLAGPAPEEVSFRGYAQHEMQKAISPVTAALIIGVGVVIWHAPLLLIGELAWPWAVCIVAVSVVYAWLYNQGGSVWPLVTLHFVVNYFGGGYFGQMLATPESQLVYALIFTAIILAWAAWIVWKFGPSLRGNRKSPLVTA